MHNRTMPIRVRIGKSSVEAELPDDDSQWILNVPAERMDEALGQLLRACLDAGYTLFEIVRE